VELRLLKSFLKNIDIINWFIIWALLLLVIALDDSAFNLFHRNVFVYVLISLIPLVYGFRWVNHLRKSRKAVIFFLINLAMIPVYYLLIGILFTIGTDVYNPDFHWSAV